jgi:MFS transporter, DHA1 family, tetracycline resistance protein
MRRTPTLAFLLVTVFINMLGLGLIVPIVPALMTAVTGSAGSGARWSGFIDSSFGITQFLIAPLLGRAADRYGRKPIMVLALVFLAINFCVHGIANTAWLLLAAHAVAGAFAATNTVVNAYIADITEPSHRSKAYGYVGAAFSLGFVAGPVLGGLLGGINVRLPFYVAGAMALANAAYGLVILPESRAGDGVTSLSWKVANPFSAIGAMLRRPELTHLTIARLLSDIARMANQVLWTFVMTSRFGWTTARLGSVMAINALAIATVQATLAGPYTRWLGQRRTAIAGAFLGAADLMAFGLVTRDWLVYPLLALGVFAAIGGPAGQAWISDLAGPQEQGTLQGALTGISAIAEASVPIVAMSVFAWTLSWRQPGLTLMCAGVSALAAALIMTRAPHKLRTHELSTVPATAD